MAVDLSDFIDSLKREVNPPGGDDFPTAVDAEWLGNMADAFWEARLDGLLAGFTCDDTGIVTPQVPIGTDPTTVPDMGRDMVQLVVLYASFRVIRNALRGLRTMFAATAGPVKFEYQQSAMVLTEIMKDLIARRDILLMRLSDLGSAPTFVIDSIIARTDSMTFQNTWWVGNGGGPTPRTGSYQ